MRVSCAAWLLAEMFIDEADMEEDQKVMCPKVLLA